MREKIIVAGLGRCGSSLLMQILDAGGFPVVGEYPSYEIDWKHNQDLSLCPEGAASKVLDLHRASVPKDNYKWIWLSRDNKQQAKSICKFLYYTTGINIPKSDLPALIKSLKVDEIHCKNIISHRAGPLLELTFEDLINNSPLVIKLLSGFIGGIDENKALSIIKPRGTNCLSGLLEVQLIEEYESRAKV